MKLLRVLPLLAISAPAACDRGPQPTAKPFDGGRVEWVDPRTIRPGPVQRDALSDEQMSRIHALQAVFVEVDGLSVEQWVDNFKRDADPDKELRVWERMANAYRAYCGGRPLSAAAKKDVYRVVLLRSMASEQDVLERIKLNELSRDDAAAVMRGF